MMNYRYRTLVSVFFVAFLATTFESLDIQGERFSIESRALAFPAQSKDPLAPKVFNSSTQGQGGDVVSIQGANFDPSVKVYQHRNAGGPIPLQIVNRVGASWIAIQLPVTLIEPVYLQLANKYGAGPLLRLNAAIPEMLDTTLLAPGGKFRILGRNLMARGHHPIVMVEGATAEIDERASDENMLVVTAPRNLRAQSGVEIRADNGNGTGPTALEGEVRAVGDGGSDPLRLGVGWAAGFSFSNRVFPSKAKCDGKADDTSTIAEAILAASKNGGATVELPAGICRIAGTINLASNVILRGAGQNITILRYEGNYPVFADGLDLVGLQSLQLLNSGQVQEGMVWRNNSRSFIREVTIKMQVSRQWFFTSNRDFLFDHNVIEQTGSFDLQNPYRFDHSWGLIFTRNRSTNTNGSPTFLGVHDAIFLNNQFTRDASSQNEGTVVAHHGFAMDFSYRIAIVRNKFDVINGPVENKTRNDGETLLVEGGGASRTENIGSVHSAGAATLSDPDNEINMNPFGVGVPANLGVAIVSGSGAGQTRRIVSYSGSTIRIDRDWDVIPDTGSHYSTFVWGLENALIIGNQLLDNPRGIWLYQSSIRDIVIEQNDIRNGGGIYLRSYQNMGAKMFTVQSHVLICNNNIVNETKRWLSYIIMAEVMADAPAFGIGQQGIEIRHNTLFANSPNVSSADEEYASREGYTTLVHVEAEAPSEVGVSSVLGTIFQSNSCDHCDRAFLIGKGDIGTILMDNRPTIGSPNFIADIDLSGKAVGGSEQSLIR
jgi:hypothetical protein